MARGLWGKDSPLGRRPELSHCTSSFVLALSGLVYVPLHPAAARLLEHFPSKSCWARGLKQLCRDACISSAGRGRRQSGARDAFPREELVIAEPWLTAGCWGSLRHNQPSHHFFFRADFQSDQPVLTGNNKRANKNRYQEDWIRLQKEGDSSTDAPAGWCLLYFTRRQPFPRDVLTLLEGSQFSQRVIHRYLCKGLVCSPNTAFLGEAHVKRGKPKGARR